MNEVQQNLLTIKQKIRTTAQSCERDPNLVQLIAVSKTKPVTQIEQAIEAGQYQFGENYVQEGVAKVQYFQEKYSQNSSTVHPLEWHFIGPLQSNKTKLVAEYFDWIHTIDRLKIAQRLNEQRPTHKEKLNVLIQVNISDENSKSGISASELSSLAAEIIQLPHLQLRGLMAIPAPETDSSVQLSVFNKMFQLFKQLQEQYPHIDTLSMGMSDDMASAIQAGSTMVRIGSAIFGARNYQ